jgi:hypothetical protein
MPPTVDFTQGTGLEQLGKSFLLALHASMNTHIVSVDAERVLMDQQFAAAMNRPYNAIITEQIANHNFHYGHTPSILQSGPSRYPNVSVLAYDSDQDGAEKPDEHDATVARLYVELMVKYGPTSDGSVDEGEPIVNARIQRTVDAALRAFVDDRFLGGIVEEPKFAPKVSILPVQKHTVDVGDRWLTQGARIEYSFNRYATAY